MGVLSIQKELSIYNDFIKIIVVEEFKELFADLKMEFMLSYT